MVTAQALDHLLENCDWVAVVLQEGDSDLYDRWSEGETLTQAEVAKVFRLIADYAEQETEE